MTDIFVTDQMKMREVSELRKYGDNPKTHPESQKEKLKKAIKEYGFLIPVVVGENDLLGDGHLRLDVAGELGIEKVPTIEAKHLSEEQLRAFRIAVNKVAESGWDEELLAAEFEALEEMDFDLELTAFDIEEIDSFMDNGKEVEEDDFVPGEDDKYDVERGQIWRLGEHRLMCGDATKEEDVEKLMDGDKADMVFTDPPYGMDLDTDYTKMSGGDRKGRQWDRVVGDSKEYDPTHIFKMFDYVKEIFLWGADYYIERIPDRKQGSLIVWNKTLDSNKDAGYNSEFELLWSRQSHKRQVISFNWFRYFGLSKQDEKKRLHPTQKPLQVLMPIIEKYSSQDDVILDLFGGSGSTLIATHQLNRKCYMLEIDPHYCSVILERYKDYTGDKPELIANGN